MPINCAINVFFVYFEYPKVRSGSSRLCPVTDYSLKSSSKAFCENPANFGKGWISYSITFNFEYADPRLLKLVYKKTGMSNIPCIFNSSR